MNIPGPRRAATGRCATGEAGLDRIGSVKTITYSERGYLLEIPSGAHAGFYEVPSAHVDHAGVEYTFAEQHDRGFITDDEWAEIQTFAMLTEQEQNAAATLLKFTPVKVKQIRAEFPQSAPASSAEPQTEPDTSEA